MFWGVEVPAIENQIPGTKTKHLAAVMSTPSMNVDDNNSERVSTGGMGEGDNDARRPRGSPGTSGTGTGEASKNQRLSSLPPDSFESSFESFESLGPFSSATINDAESPPIAISSGVKKTQSNPGNSLLIRRIKSPGTPPTTSTTSSSSTALVPPIVVSESNGRSGISKAKRSMDDEDEGIFSLDALEAANLSTSKSHQKKNESPKSKAATSPSLNQLRRKSRHISPIQIPNGNLSNTNEPSGNRRVQITQLDVVDEDEEEEEQAVERGNAHNKPKTRANDKWLATSSGIANSLFAEQEYMNRTQQVKIEKSLRSGKFESEPVGKVNTPMLGTFNPATDTRYPLVLVIHPEGSDTRDHPTISPRPAVTSVAGRPASASSLEAKMGRATRSSRSRSSVRSPGSYSLTHEDGEHFRFGTPDRMTGSDSNKVLRLPQLLVVHFEDAGDETFRPVVLKHLILFDDFVYQVQDVYGPEDEDANTCVVCLEATMDTIFLPCRHYCVCEECYEQLNPKVCPLCREKVTGFLSVVNNRSSTGSDAAAERRHGSGGSRGGGSKASVRSDEVFSEV
eukprot:TRINITY_DN2139_c0_g1_i7.p1 TRINITY_DN2139_c0_g1~~TRINITY_DN2139_c0_g1_i7.p1  ORF type:complete len:566 (+),score=99.11 TRINITY_DN2139_c0_g1_i7:1321-3018(+)